MRIPKRPKTGREQAEERLKKFLAMCRKNNVRPPTRADWDDFLGISRGKDQPQKPPAE